LIEMEKNVDESPDGIHKSFSYPSKIEPILPHALRIC
jgi:hypothetical protein